MSEGAHCGSMRRRSCEQCAKFDMFFGLRWRTEASVHLQLSCVNPHAVLKGAVGICSVDHNLGQMSRHLREDATALVLPDWVSVVV